MVMFRRVYRVCVFCPPNKVSEIIAAALQHDRLSNGPYDKVVWTSAPGVEQFEPVDGATPTKGSIGAVSADPSIRVEFSLPFDQNLLDRVIDKVKDAHPWQRAVILVSECQEWAGFKE